MVSEFAINCRMQRMYLDATERFDDAALASSIKQIIMSAMYSPLNQREAKSPFGGVAKKWPL